MRWVLPVSARNSIPRGRAPDEPPRDRGDQAQQQRETHGERDGDGERHRPDVVEGGADDDQTVDVPFPFAARWDDLLAGFAGGDPWSIEVTGPRAAVGVGSRFGRVLRAWNPA